MGLRAETRLPSSGHYGHLGKPNEHRDRRRWTGSELKLRPAQQFPQYEQPSVTVISRWRSEVVWATELHKELAPTTRSSGRRPNNTNKVYPESAGQPKPPTHHIPHTNTRRLIGHRGHSLRPPLPLPTTIWGSVSVRSSSSTGLRSGSSNGLWPVGNRLPNAVPAAPATPH